MVTWGFWTLYSTGTPSAIQQILTTSASLMIICGDRRVRATPLDRLVTALRLRSDACRSTRAPSVRILNLIYNSKMQGLVLHCVAPYTAPGRRRRDGRETSEAIARSGPGVCLAVR